MILKNPGFWAQQSRLNTDVIRVECVIFYLFLWWFPQQKKGNIIRIFFSDKVILTPD